KKRRFAHRNGCKSAMLHNQAHIIRNGIFMPLFVLAFLPFQHPFACNVVCEHPTLNIVMLV
ncbi:hypothetical protein MKP27_003638, partial [Acinetobacter baumannii]